jgi:DNA-binding NtrC family response regulator
MTQARSKIIYGVLKHRLAAEPDSRLLSLTEQLQAGAGNNRWGTPVPGQEGVTKMETTLLMVDDNIPLLELSSRHIGMMRPHWRLALAHSVAEARRVNGLCRPDAAVLDVELPDGSGLDLLHEFKLARPELPVVVVSGSAPVPLCQVVSASRGVTFLPKPFLVSELVMNIELGLSAMRLKSAGRGAPAGNHGCRRNPHAIMLSSQWRNLETNIF